MHVVSQLWSVTQGEQLDVVIDGVTGILVDSSKVDEISNAICKLLDDPIKSKQMGEAGRDWVCGETGR